MDGTGNQAGIAYIEIPAVFYFRMLIKYTYTDLYQHLCNMIEYYFNTYCTLNEKYVKQSMMMLTSAFYYRGVVPGGAGGAMAPPDFGISVNLISTGSRLCPPT